MFSSVGRDVLLSAEVGLEMASEVLAVVGADLGGLEGIVSVRLFPESSWPFFGTLGCFPSSGSFATKIL